MQPKLGTSEGGDGQEPGRILYPLPSGRVPERFIPGSGVWVAVIDGGAEAGVLNMAQSETFPDYQTSASWRGRLAASSAFWLEVTLASLCSSTKNLGG